MAGSLGHGGSGFLARLAARLRGRPATFALVGKSGTGKSFKARIVAQRYRIELIIDDGLVIRGQKILAGRSAKREKGILGAVRTAVFADPEQVAGVRRVLSTERFRRILVIGTSMKMVQRIVATLGLPPISRVIPIETVSSRDEIGRALRVREEQGKHIIPVPAIEVKRSYPHIFFESIMILLQGARGVRRRTGKQLVEKTVVRPPYSRIGRAKTAIAEAPKAQSGS